MPGLAGLSLAGLVSAFTPPARAADQAPPQAPPVAQAAPPAIHPTAPTAPTAPAPPAARAPDADAAMKRFPRLAPPTMSHYLQFGLALLPGTGYRAIFPYQEMINCGEAGKRVCTGRLGTFLDVQPSFGFASHWDVVVDLRFGLEEDFTGTHEFAVAPGVRYWVDPREHAKFFATIQAAFDTTEQHDPRLPHNDDVALRNSNGFMYEIMRNFGVYAQFGETIGFVRWLRFEIDAGLGVQARLP
jgi:hypothetical protein